MKKKILGNKLTYLLKLIFFKYKKGLKCKQINNTRTTTNSKVTA